jgi:hypothetical protein
VLELYQCKGTYTFATYLQLTSQEKVKVTPAQQIHRQAIILCNISTLNFTAVHDEPLLHEGMHFFITLLPNKQKVASFVISCIACV